MTTLRSPPLSLLDKYHGQDGQTLYTATVTVTAGEPGHGCAVSIARSDDGNLALELRVPEPLGGPGGGANPEQLFAAGYAACFRFALCLVAAKANIAVPDASVEVSVSFARDPVDGLFVLSADTRVHLPGVERAVAEALVRNTERYCPYTKMARQGIVNIVARVRPDDEAGEP
jgi:Ohr subfamily peroxiredoxin